MKAIILSSRDNKYYIVDDVTEPTLISNQYKADQIICENHIKEFFAGLSQDKYYEVPQEVTFEITKTESVNTATIFWTKFPSETIPMKSKFLNEYEFIEDAAKTWCEKNTLSLDWYKAFMAGAEAQRKYIYTLKGISHE